MTTRKLFRAFTLIELLIVVAIIAILAAIAVPNFLEAQVRSKVSRVKSDMRSLGTAIEAYAVDYNGYPLGRVGSKAMEYAEIRKVSELSTPVAYITSTDIRDPFGGTKALNGAANKVNGYATLYYQNFANNSGWMTWQKAFTAGLPTTDLRCWYLESWGPDRTQNGMEYWILAKYLTNASDRRTIDELYDSTNGTMSRGDIGRLGGAYPPEVAIINK